MKHPIEYCITLFSGFLQNQGSPGSGFVRLEHEGYEICNGLSNMRVRLYPWDTNEQDIAESLWRYRPNLGQLQTHIVIGYSYGGDRAVKFCNALAERGEVTVRHLGLCDAVRRFDALPGVAAGFGIGKLVIPNVVENVFWYKQKNPRWSLKRLPKSPFEPAGHKVVGQFYTTQIGHPVISTAHHSYIDNDSRFRQTFLSKVSELSVEALESITQQKRVEKKPDAC